ncbi:hypothetical protein [Aquiflexum sp.]|uniref:hypothetical protein n=1 Tax=Aquiflexum sp. TaxID=1872584 RepID=UPI003594159B
MKENLSISKNPILPPSMDYEWLRNEGLKYIETLAHDSWTDYNAHDPGITILEVLCYAITELGYRSDFEMKDLLSGSTEQTFFTAREILTSAPWTITDYRKLLVDIAGINNAWIITDPKQEVAIYANCEEDKLQYVPTDQEIKLSGLYTVLLDLMIDPELGDLNTGDIVLENIAFELNPMVQIEEGEFQLKFEFPSVNEVESGMLKMDPQSLTIQQNPEENKSYIFHLEYEDGETKDLNFKVTIPKNPTKGKIQESHIWLMLQDVDFGTLIFETYLEKIHKAKTIIDNAAKTLHENRNLCEDFIKVEPISSEEIAFCFDVDVKPHSDIEKIQAEIFFVIENYLNPPISFYTLKELMEDQIPVEEIFEGPNLNYGFILTEEIENAQLRQIVYASDIINLLMDIEGVLSIRNFLMTKYDKEGKVLPGFSGLSWCMKISPLHKPVLSKNHTKIIFFKEGFPFLSRYGEVSDTIVLLHAQNSRGKLSLNQFDLGIPKGTKRDTLSYWPAQYDLPMTFGVGEFGLPSNADSLRKAQQQQLKGYLMFFEQLLADFYAQLSHSKNLFSTSDIKQTYFAQYLGEIKETENLFDPNLKRAIENDSSDSLGQELWQKLYENKNDFFDRRNRFLDHLLGRFAESFQDYALLMYRINYENLSEEKIQQQEAIDIKIRTLKSYSEVSYARGLAFNYFPQTPDFSLDEGRLWDTNNVSGLEKRISYMTGIKDFNRRFLYCIKNVEILCEETQAGEEIHCNHYFSLTSRSGIILNSKKFEVKSEAEAVLEEVMELGIHPENYHYTTKKIKLKKQNIIILESTQTFDTEEEALEEISEIVTELSNPCADPEGLHLIEHLLLRPRTSEFKLMEVCLHDCDCLCELDPYSFRVSVILPHWPRHFDNMYFRKYFERKMREEAPAHIQLKICWVGNEALRQFEISYMDWVETLAAFSQDSQNQEAFREANDRLIEIIANLNSVYPKATLHDCEESDIDKNPVKLGHTTLGTQKFI